MVIYLHFMRDGSLEARHIPRVDVVADLNTKQETKVFTRLCGNVED